MRLNTNPTQWEVIAVAEAAGRMVGKRKNGRMDSRVVEYLGARSRQFQEATSKKRGPANRMMYGGREKE